MKKIFNLVFLLTLIQGVTGQKTYVDLQPLTILKNPIEKTGWDTVFHDEFNGSKNPMWQNRYCWCGNTIPGFSTYFIDQNYSFGPRPGSLTLISKKEDYTPSGSIIKKPYTSAMLYSSPCGAANSLPTPNRTWVYGYFEIRCKNPKGQLMWPAFWLFGDANSTSTYNELDVFEFGTGDAVVMTNHYQAPNANVHSLSKWIYSMPGQTFGDTWVTYALKWEPNKLVWYINNQPVRIVTNLSSIIPTTAMGIIIGGGANDFYTSGTLNLPKNFPNSMVIDYVRVYQRNNYSIPNPIFSINKKQGFTIGEHLDIDFSLNTPIYIDASESYMPNHLYYLSIMECNQLGVIIPNTEYVGVIDGSDISQVNNINLTAFIQSKGGSLSSNKHYIVKLAGSSPWTEKFQYIHLVNCNGRISFKINGNDNTVWPTPIVIKNNDIKTRIILDATQSISCNNSYWVSFFECNSSGVQIGTEKGGWISSLNWTSGFSKKILESLDVEFFAQTVYNYVFQRGHYYTIKLAIGPNWTEKHQLVYIEPCIDNVIYSINDNYATFPSVISIENGQDILLDGANSMICNNNFYFSIQECNSAGSIINGANEVYEWAANGTSNGVLGDETVYYYIIGRYNIREFCSRKNYELGCGKYYRVKLATGSLFNEVKIIYIEPCLNVNSSYLINYTDQQSYNFSNTNVDLKMYAPNSISCNRNYFVSVQKMLNGVLVEPEVKDWLNPFEVYFLLNTGAFDLKAFAMDSNHNSQYPLSPFSFANNCSYRVRMVASAGICNQFVWNTTDKIINFGSSKSNDNNEELIVAKNEIDETFIEVSPNPSNNQILLQVPNNDKNSMLDLGIYDLQGNRVKYVNFSGDICVVEISDLASGVYFLRIILNNTLITKKIIKT